LINDLRIEKIENGFLIKTWTDEYGSPKLWALNDWDAVVQFVKNTEFTKEAQ
jgi:hypothetical protein